MCTRPARARTGLLALLASASLLACGGGAKVEYGSLAQASLEGLWVLDLSEEHPFARRMEELEELRPADPVHQHLLMRGWSVNDGSMEERAEADWAVWAQGHQSEVQLFLREPAARTLRLGLQPVRSEKHVLSYAAVRLNGHLVAEQLLPKSGLHPWEVELPAKWQRVGENDLAFSFSHTEHLNPMKSDARALSASMRTLRLEIGAGDVAERSRQARKLLPGGSRVLPQEGGRRGVIEQVSGSALAYHLIVPEQGPFLQLAVYYAGGHTTRARFRITAERDGVAPVVVVDELVEEGVEARSLRVDLDAFRAEPVGFVFEVLPIDSQGELAPDPVVGTWVGPLLAADAPSSLLAPPEAADRTGVSELAAELRGAPVIVLLLDALRADALEFYGGRAGLVPNLSRVAAEGTVFDQAYAHAAYTLSSVASTLTSRPTWEHGVWRKENKVLDGVGTWPEGFRAAGYRTAAVTHTPNGSSMSGFERGFDTYIENLRSGGRSTFAVQVLDSVDEILAADDGRPLFLWLHLLEPHEPYMPPEPWSERFDPDYEGEVHGVKEFLLGIRGGGIRPTPTELKHLRLEYDANLGYVDEVIGELRTSLEEAGVWDEAVFVLFSDHGEAFMEHRVKGVAHQGHGRSIYEEVMRIPLVVRLPTRLGRAGLRSEGLVNSLDLYPTLAELLGVEWSGAPHSGRSFAEQLVEAGAPGRPSALYHTSSWSRDRFYPGFGMRVGRHKFFLSPGEYFELYDLEADPGELRNLAPEQPVLARALLEHFAAQTGWDALTGGWTLQQGAQSEISEAQLELLDALGYGGD